MGKPAARLGDDHSCPLSEGSKPHKGLSIAQVKPSKVYIEGKLTATAGDIAPCNGPPDTLAEGAEKVFIKGALAARQGDKTAHGGVITSGAKKVFIG